MPKLIIYISEQEKNALDELSRLVVSVLVNGVKVPVRSMS